MANVEVSKSWVDKSHEARTALGEMLKLVEDGVLVRNIKDDADATKYLNQSLRLTRILRQAQKSLETPEA